MRLLDLFARIRKPEAKSAETFKPLAEAEAYSHQLRRWVRHNAGLTANPSPKESVKRLCVELRYIFAHADEIRMLMQQGISKRVLFSGQMYYNVWYLSRALRTRGWKADLLNWDTNPATQMYYHGEDIAFTAKAPADEAEGMRFYVASLYGYDAVHFSNFNGISFGFPVHARMEKEFGVNAEIRLLKALGKKILYANNGCLDGVAQSSFAKWSTPSVCSICKWQQVSEVCNDKKSLDWGAFRNRVADYQFLLGGNRVDYNYAPTVHEGPEIYCLDPDFWHPELVIPDTYKLPPDEAGTVRLYHAVGHRADRTRDDGTNIKSSHVYLPLIDKLKAEGCKISLLEPTGIPNKELRYIQLQADIFLDMLSYGWFGANVREAMMLAKPVICYLRPEWLASLARELPEYAAELPIVQATPETVEQVLRDLIANPEKRSEIGRKSRAFMLKWHASGPAAARYEQICMELLRGNPLLLEAYA